MATISQGTLFEYRLQRLFFYEGFFTRRAIDLYLDSTAGTKVTDIDVLALSLSPGFRPSLVIVECKTTASAEEEMDRLLWLRGMIRFLHASTGVLAKTSLSPHIKGFARQLGLQAFDTSRIGQREQDLGITDQWVGSHNVDWMEGMKAQVRSLAKIHPDVRRLSQFLGANFWWQDNIERFKKTCSALSKIGELYPRAKELEHKAVIRSLYYEAIILLTVSFLCITERAVELTEREFRDFLYKELASGIGTPDEFSRLSAIITDFMNEAVRIETGHYPTKPVPVPRLEPPQYSDAAAEVVNRLSRQSNAARDILRFEDVLFYEHILRDQPVDWNQLARLFPYGQAMLLKQTQNVVHFAANHLGIPQPLADEILTLSRGTSPVTEAKTTRDMPKQAALPAIEEPTTVTDRISAEKDLTETKDQPGEPKQRMQLNSEDAEDSSPVQKE